MPTQTNIFKNYPNNYFIETGSYIGNGIAQAIDAGFKHIISIELSYKYFVLCKNKFQNYSFVNIIHGDSCKILSNVISYIREPITFWLDGHYSSGDTAIGQYPSPLMQELDSISNHLIKNHTIIIDDMRCWQKSDPLYNFDTFDIIKKIYEINPKYKIEYVDGHEKSDILIAHIK